MGFGPPAHNTFDIHHYANSTNMHSPPSNLRSTGSCKATLALDTLPTFCLKHLRTAPPLHHFDHKQRSLTERAAVARAGLPPPAPPPPPPPPTPLALALAFPGMGAAPGTGAARAPGTGAAGAAWAPVAGAGAALRTPGAGAGARVVPAGGGAALRAAGAGAWLAPKPGTGGLLPGSGGVAAVAPGTRGLCRLATFRRAVTTAEDAEEGPGLAAGLGRAAEEGGPSLKRGADG